MALAFRCITSLLTSSYLWSVYYVCAINYGLSFSLYILLDNCHPCVEFSRDFKTLKQRGRKHVCTLNPSSNASLPVFSKKQFKVRSFLLHFAFNPRRGFYRPFNPNLSNPDPTLISGTALRNVQGFTLSPSYRDQAGIDTRSWVSRARSRTVDCRSHITLWLIAWLIPACFNALDLQTNLDLPAPLTSSASTQCVTLIKAHWYSYEPKDIHIGRS